MRLGFKYILDTEESVQERLDTTKSVAIYGCVDIRANTLDTIAISTKGNVVIHENGCVYGDILARGSVFVEQNAKVVGNITAQRVIVVDGEVIGNVVSNKKTYVSAIGTIKGNITTPNLNMVGNSHYEGLLTITGGKSDILEIKKLAEIG